MKDLYFVVTDGEGKRLLDKFKDLHPHGNELVFKLLLKFYVKFATWHRKKGRNPINAFQELIEREVGGKSSLSDKDRIRYLNQLIEEGEENVDSSKFELAKDIEYIKDFMVKMGQEGAPRQAPLHYKPVEGASLDGFRPTDDAVLKKVKNKAPKKRKNYRDLRSKGSVKKIDF